MRDNDPNNSEPMHVWSPPTPIPVDEVVALRARVGELEWELSEVVDDSVTTVTNGVVPMMRCTPHLPRYIAELKHREQVQHDAGQRHAQALGRALATVRELRAALQPFEQLAPLYDGEPPGAHVVGQLVENVSRSVTVGDFRNARALLARTAWADEEKKP